VVGGWLALFPIMPPVSPSPLPPFVPMAVTGGGFKLRKPPSWSLWPWRGRCATRSVVVGGWIELWAEAPSVVAQGNERIFLQQLKQIRLV
jgi:hypothetical protein